MLTIPCKTDQRNGDVHYFGRPYTPVLIIKLDFMTYNSCSTILSNFFFCGAEIATLTAGHRNRTILLTVLKSEMISPLSVMIFIFFVHTKDQLRTN